jgi:hypothetical protein
MMKAKKASKGPAEVLPKAEASSAEVVDSAEAEEKVAEKKVNYSQQIRKMSRNGMSPAEIAKQLGKRYQMVYNVLVRDELITPKKALVDLPREGE